MRSFNVSAWHIATIERNANANSIFGPPVLD
jgi:hypothetical protein